MVTKKDFTLTRLDHLSSVFYIDKERRRHRGGLRRYAVIIPFLLIGIGLSSYLYLEFALKRISEKVIQTLIMDQGRFGVQILEPHYESVYISSISSASWTNIRALLALKGNSVSNEDRFFLLEIPKLTISLEDFSFDTFLITAEKFSLGLHENNLMPTVVGHNVTLKDLGFDGFQGTRARLLVKADIRDPNKSIKQIADEALKLFETGKTTLDIDLSGQVLFSVGPIVYPVGVSVASVNNKQAIVLEKSDLRQLATRYEVIFTDEELGIVSQHPLHAPHFLKIKDYATYTAKQLYFNDNTVPYNAYQHVLWSYLLTKRFGAELASEITEAHEAHKHVKMKEDAKIDRTNNAVGRELAAKGISESDLLRIVRTDPRVDRSPVSLVK